MGRGEEVAAPKSLAKRLSLYKQRLRLALDVAKNLAGPEVVVDAGVALIVLALVSRALAVA